MNSKSAEFADFVCADRFVLLDPVIQKDPAEDDDEEDDIDEDEDEEKEDEQDDDSDGYSE